MPTARELLEHADALMRKNRSPGDPAIPVLTDAVGTRPPVVATPASEIPVLTDRVEEIIVDLKPLPDAPQAANRLLEDDPTYWLVMDTIDPAMHSITGKAPDTVAIVPPVTLKTAEPAPQYVDLAPPVTFKAAGSAPTPPPARSEMPERSPPSIEISAVETPSAPDALQAAHAEAPPAPAGATDDDRWRALAEQISMQVLQRIDLFTDTGLKEQLAHHLKPIVERANAELVGAINTHVGELVRSYIAEAIEREIAQWRRENR
jgi:hypothetical protein